MAELKLYKRRWLMLAVFSLVSLTNGYQWIQYSTISNVIREFYGKNDVQVNWLSLIYMLAYMLVFVANWVVDRYGVMPAIVCGSFGNAAAAWIKVLSADGDRFWLTFAGQALAGTSQIFLLGLPACLAAIWFGPKEVSTATSLAVFGNQLGVALGFLLPPIFVPNPDPWDQKLVESHLRTMFLCTACVSTTLFITVLLTFKRRPPTPPSNAQAAIVTASKDGKQQSGFKQYWQLAKHRGFLLLFASYGLNVGVSYAISTLLNPIVLNYYENAEKAVGELGLIMVVAGLVGAIIVGLILDRTRMYWWTSFLLNGTSTLLIAAFLGSLLLNRIWTVYIVSAIFGLFINSVIPMGFEFGAEITYPINEATSSSMLNVAAQIGGIGLTSLTQFINDTFGIHFGIIGLCAALLLSTICTALIKEDLRRQRAEMNRLEESTTESQEQRSHLESINSSITPPPIYSSAVLESYSSPLAKNESFLQRL